LAGAGEALWIREGLVALSPSQQRGDYGGGQLTVSDPAVFIVRRRPMRSV
jgi:hypothetical protein